MKVLVNATPLLSPLTGIGQYIRHLFTAMQQTGKTELRLYTGLRCLDMVTLPPEGSAPPANEAITGFSVCCPDHVPCAGWPRN